MALDFGSMISSASPLSSAGLDPDELLASGRDPREILAQVRSGMGLARGPENPAAAPGPVAASAPPNVASNGTLATPATASAADGNRAVPGTVTPTGKPAQWSELARQSLQSGMGAATAAGQSLDDIRNLEQKRQQYATPTPAYDPQTGKVLDPFKPTVGQRIVRGIQNFATGGIPGVIAPAATGGTPYGAPNRQYQIQEQQRQQQLGNIDQRIAGETAIEKEQVGQATALGGIGKDAGTAAKDTGIPASVVNQAAKLGAKVQRDPDTGELSLVDDPTSEAYKQREVLNGLRGAQQAEAEARAELAKSQNDPNSPAYRLAVQRVKTAAANSAAATERAQAYMLNAYGANLGTNPETGQALPGATETPEGTPMGSRNASLFSKREANVAQFNDVLGATDQLEKTAKALVDKGGTGALSDSVIAAALAEPKGTFGKWVQGQVANGNMSPEQRDYVTNLRAYRENLQALRKSAGGGVSDSQVDRLMEMAPGASTPDLDYLMRQTGQIRQTANRLSKGITKTAGGTAVEGQGGAPKRPEGVPDSAVWNKQGNNGKGSWQLPQQ